MRRPRKISSAAVFPFAALLIACSMGYGQSRPALSPQDQDKRLALGKGIFVERCAKCHGEDGSKPLSDGLPLNERQLSAEQITRSVAGRLKSLPEEQRQAVTRYIISFQKSTEE